MRLVFLPAGRVPCLKRRCQLLFVFLGLGFPSLSHAVLSVCSAGWERPLNVAFFAGVFQDRPAGGHEQDVGQRPRHRFCSLCPSLSRHHRPAAKRPRHQQNHSVRAAPSRLRSVLHHCPDPCYHVGFNAAVHPVGVWNWSSMSR